eukprot:1673931-Prymnesium_polylepis.1
MPSVMYRIRVLSLEQSSKRTAVSYLCVCVARVRVRSKNLGAQVDFHLIRNAPCNTHRGDPPRLRHGDDATRIVARCEQKLRDLRRLAAAGLSGQYNRRRRRNLFQYRAAHAPDGEFSACGIERPL